MAQPYVGEIILVGFDFAPAGWAFCDGSILPISENETLFNLIGTTYGGDGQETFALPDLRGRAPIHMGTGPAGTPYQLAQAGGSESIVLTLQQIPVHGHPLDITGASGTVQCRDAAGNQSMPVGRVPAVGPYVPFSDDPAQTGETPIKAAHITELRSRIDGLRTTVLLGPYPYNDPAISAGTLLRAQHILDLRAAITEYYTKASLPPPSFADLTLAPGAPVKAAYVMEIRAALSAVPPGVSAAYSSQPPDGMMRASGVQITGVITSLPSGGNQPHDNRQPYLAMNYCIALFGVFPSQS